jgi:hypothetical protein
MLFSMGVPLQVEVLEGRFLHGVTPTFYARHRTSLLACLMGCLLPAPCVSRGKTRGLGLAGVVSSFFRAHGKNFCRIESLNTTQQI